MAKSPVLNVEGKVRKSTIKFAQALLDAGVKVTSVFPALTLSNRIDRSTDCLFIRGKGRFKLSILIDYENDSFFVRVLTRKGHMQTQATCTTHNEFQALCKVWNIVTF